ncbi:MAG: ATP-binding protein, partial [Candidatus Eremiobacteraeota bacterium]|nr:ATP-binding protein [Candidatus Eremiobacteraeota bacterium]
GLRGRFHLGGRGLLPGITAAVYHAGVKVRPCYAIGELALLDFPDVVELTEGRDALKPGPAFAAVVAAFHRRLARLGARRAPAAEASGPEEGEEEAAGAAARLRIAELAAQISALMLESVSFREAAPELARALLAPGRFLVAAERVEAVVGFLGPGAEHKVFAPESFWAVREWQGLLPGERELLEDELSFDPPEALSSLARRRPDLPGLAILAARARAADAVTVMLARARKPALRLGALPCLGARGAVLVRADADGVRAPTGWRERYALQTSFDRALGVREPEVERHLIVDSPLRAVRGLGGGGGGGG